MAHGKMPKTLHRDLIAVAETVAPVLARDIEKVGPLWFPDRSGDVTAFLARAVVGQQLSAKAARSIWARVETAAGAELAAFLHDDNLATLGSCGLSRGKVKALCGIGAAARAGFGSKDLREKYPRLITVDISGLEMGKAIHVKDISINGVTILESDEEVVASVHAPRAEEAAAVAAVAGVAAAPVAAAAPAPAKDKGKK